MRWEVAFLIFFFPEIDFEDVFKNSAKDFIFFSIPKGSYMILY